MEIAELPTQTKCRLSSALYPNAFRLPLLMAARNRVHEKPAPQGAQGRCQPPNESATVMRRYQTPIGQHCSDGANDVDAAFHCGGVRLWLSEQEQHSVESRLYSARRRQPNLEKRKTGRRHEMAR